MSFVTQEEVFQEVEAVMIEIFEEFSDWRVEAPFPRIPYKEAMAKYGIDKPDLRYGMLLQDASEILKDCALNFISNVIKEGGSAQASCGSRRRWKIP